MLVAALYASTLLSANTINKGSQVRELTVASVLLDPTSLNRLRLDLESDVKTCHRASVEGSLHMPKSCWASATAGTDLCSDGYAWGLAVERRLQRCKFMYRLFSESNFGRQVLLQVHALVGKSKRLDASLVRHLQYPYGEGTRVGCSLAHVGSATATLDNHESRLQRDYGRSSSSSLRAGGSSACDYADDAKWTVSASVDAQLRNYTLLFNVRKGSVCLAEDEDTYSSVS